MRRPRLQALLEAAFRAPVDADDQSDLVLRHPIQALDGEKRVLLRPSHDEARDDVEDPDGLRWRR